MHVIQIRKSKLFRYICFLLESTGIFFIGGFCLCGIMLSGTIPAVMLIWMAHLLWSMSAFCLARRMGMHGRRYGMFRGLLCGVLVCVLLFIGNALLHEIVTKRILVRCLLILLSGIVGGVIGVNTPIRKPPY